MTHRLSTGWIGCIAAMRFPAAARGDAKNLISAFHGSFVAKPGSQATIARLFAKSLPLALTVVLLAIGLPGAAAAQSVSFQGLPGPSGGSTATGISADGTVVVGNTGSGGNCGEAASWTNGTIALLGFPGGGSCSFANGANSNGTVIAGIGNNAGQNAPVIWTNGTATILPQNYNCCGSPPPPCGAGALGVNANATGPTSSVLVGADGSGSPGCGPGIPIKWVNGTEVPFLGWSPPQSGEASGANADGSVIVGRYGGEAFRWTSGDGQTPEILGDLGGGSSEAYAINSDGSVVVGTAAVDIVNSKAFRWTASTGLVGLGPAAIFAEALAVNGDGSVVVGQMHNAGPAFRWTTATGFLNLQALLKANGVDITTIGPAPNNTWSGLTQATGISADGTTIVGFGGGPSAQGQAWIAHLPVNATILAHTHDFNGDGYSDIAWRDTSGDNAMWLMNGGSILSSAGLGTISTAWSIVGQRDFNGDGMADWLWRDTSGDLAIWFLNGLTVMSGVGLGTVNPVWSIVATGDFNGDGKGDILWRDTSGDIAMWLMNGSTILSSAGLGSLSTSWSVAGTGDFNGNGNWDILWQDTSGDIAIWFMNGTTVTSGVGLGTIAPPWTIVGTGDFNGDGKSDILWRNTSTGAIAVWLMNGSTILSSAGLGSLSTTWSIVETGDFNGDGMSDVLWHDTSGDAAIWFMNGTTVSSGVGLGTIATSWIIQGAGAD